MTFHLSRKPAVGKAIYGTLTAVSSPENTLASVTTLENADFLIPCTANDAPYSLELTFSPRFGKELPIVLGVPKRSGIRLHLGTKPEHSRGCILLSEGNLNRIVQLLKRNCHEKHVFYVSAR